MTVLSDKTIKERVAKNELVPQGNVDKAMHCSYEFAASSILRGGSPKVEPIVESGVVIEPAQLVWIRAKEEISIPADMVGLWIQTQTLARQGLLLLNITLIEPGYEGPLSAVFVNFGNKKVIISPDTKIAKVVFLTLDKKADELVEKWNSKTYEAKLLDMAANAPETFLQLQSFLPKIEAEANAKLEAIDKEIERSVDFIVKQTRLTLKKDLQSDLRGTFIRWGGGIIAGFFISCAAVWFGITTFLPRLTAEYSKVDELARKASMVQQAETMNGLSTKLRTLATEIESLKKQVQNDLTNTKAVSDPNKTDQN